MTSSPMGFDNHTPSAGQGSFRSSQAPEAQTPTKEAQGTLVKVQQLTNKLSAIQRKIGNLRTQLKTEQENYFPLFMDLDRVRRIEGLQKQISSLETAATRALGRLQQTTRGATCDALAVSGVDFAKQALKGAQGNESCYVDMGLLYGQWVYANAVVWYPEPCTINKTVVDEFLADFFTQLKADGVSDLRYSFEQICDIFNIINSEPGSWADTISIIYTDNFIVTDPKTGESTGKNFLEYMTSQANQNGFSNTMAFGGALAGSAEMTLPDTAENSAEALKGFMDNTSIQHVDFDIEGSEALVQCSTQDNLDFFASLKTLLTADGTGRKSTITVAGDINTFPTEISDNLTTYFNGICLMLYSNTVYYIDATGAEYTWSLDQWLTLVGGVDNSHLLSIGFYDSIAYENPASSAGKTYNVEGLTRGQAAAAIYIQVCADLGKTVNDFAAPFWWTDDPTTLPSDEVLEDFYAYLGEHVSSSSRMLEPKGDDRAIKEHYIGLGKQVGKRPIMRQTSQKTHELVTHQFSDERAAVQATEVAPTVTEIDPDAMLAVAIQHCVHGMCFSDDDRAVSTQKEPEINSDDTMLVEAIQNYVFGMSSHRAQTEQTLVRGVPIKPLQVIYGIAPAAVVFPSSSSRS